MKTPGFTAEESLSRRSGQYRMAQTNHGGMSVQPAASLRMSPQGCYRRDSNCTQFCAQIKDADWRYECFSRCNIYLDNCLSTGNWTDRVAAQL